MVAFARRNLLKTSRKLSEPKQCNIHLINHHLISTAKNSLTNEDSRTPPKQKKSEQNFFFHKTLVLQQMEVCISTKNKHTPKQEKLQDPEISAWGALFVVFKYFLKSLCFLNQIASNSTSVYNSPEVPQACRKFLSFLRASSPKSIPPRLTHLKSLHRRATRCPGLEPLA